MPKVSFIVPLYASCQDRLRNWCFVSRHIQSIGNHERIAAEFETNYGYFGGFTRLAFDSFHKTQMLNVAAASAKHDILCFADSDFVMPIAAWRNAINLMSRYDVVSPYDRISLLGPQQTQNRINGTKFKWSMNLPESRWGNLCGGVVFFRRDAFEKCRGWDERFTHWGYEDAAMGRVVRKLKLRWHICKETAVHLWHPKTHRANGLKPSSECYAKHYHGKTISEIFQHD
jgi:GT2 family glycosyltransferase